MVPFSIPRKAVSRLSWRMKCVTFKIEATFTLVVS